MDSFHSYFFKKSCSQYCSKILVSSLSALHFSNAVVEGTYSAQTIPTIFVPVVTQPLILQRAGDGVINGHMSSVLPLESGTNLLMKRGRPNLPFIHEWAAQLVKGRFG